MVERVKIYHIGGSSAEMDAFDAREALQRHADEWAQDEWPEGSKPVVQDGTGGGSGDEPKTYEARDKGKGWWAIYDVEGNEVGKSIREAEGVEFNKMPDEDKAAYVELHVADN